MLHTPEDAERMIEQLKQQPRSGNPICAPRLKSGSREPAVAVSRHGGPRPSTVSFEGWRSIRTELWDRSDPS